MTEPAVFHRRLSPVLAIRFDGDNFRAVGAFVGDRLVLATPDRVTFRGGSLGLSVTPG